MSAVVPEWRILRHPPDGRSHHTAYRAPRLSQICPRQVIHDSSTKLMHEPGRRAGKLILPRACIVNALPLHPLTCISINSTCCASCRLFGSDWDAQDPSGRPNARDNAWQHPRRRSYPTPGGAFPVQSTYASQSPAEAGNSSREGFRGADKLGPGRVYPLKGQTRRLPLSYVL